MTTTGLVTGKVRFGIAMMLVAYFLFALVDTSVKWLLIAGVPALQLAFLRYAVHFAISVFEASWRGAQGGRVPRNDLGWLVLRAASLAAATVGNFIALRYLPLTITSAIMFSAPIILCLLSGPVLGERVGPWRWGAILIGFAGVLVVIRPFGEDFHWAALISFSNAILMAVYSLLTRKLADRTSASTMQFFTGAVGTFALAPFAFFVWVPAPDTTSAILFFLLGLFAWSGHELLSRAHVFAQASTLSLFSYSFLIFLILSSYIVFDHLPDQATVVGAVIIVIAGIVIWLREEYLRKTHGPATGTVG